MFVRNDTSETADKVDFESKGSQGLVDQNYP